MLWPFGQRAAVVLVPILLVLGLALLGILRQMTGWPGASIETLVLTGLLIVALTPPALAVIDMIASRGGTFEYAGLLKISFAAAVAPHSLSAVPANIGLRGVPVADHNSHDIIATLRIAINSKVVIVDLEDGSAWWETRLFVLCAGAGPRLAPKSSCSPQPRLRILASSKAGRRHVCFAKA